MLAKTKNYRPTDKEPFMNERQREYFRVKLLAWREDILKEAKETLQHLQEENQNHADIADRASSETDRAIELRARDRQRKLVAKIDESVVFAPAAQRELEKIAVKFQCLVQIVDFQDDVVDAESPGFLCGVIIHDNLLVKAYFPPSRIRA